MSSFLPPATPSRFPAAVVRGLVLLLLAITMMIAGCGGSTNAHRQCEATTPTTRMWLSHTLAVALSLPPNTAIPDAAISDAVGARLNTILKASSIGSLSSSPPTKTDAAPTAGNEPPLARGGNDATAFYYLTPDASYAPANSACDQSVLDAVDAIDGALGAKSGQGTTVLTPLPVQVAESETSGAKVTISILGASPDWIFTGRPSGGGWGHPGGPPVLPPSGYFPVQETDLAAPASSDGQGTTVVVLDTGYQLDRATGLPSSAVACGADSCAPPPAALTLSSKVVSAIPSSKDPLLAQVSRVVQESDMQLQTDLPEPGSSPSQPLAEFFDTSGKPVTIVDHGLFISGLIHQAAPAAKIVLVRVLNDYGVGDLRSILTGVNTVAYHPESLGITSGNIVVNMSFGFGPSASCLVGTFHGWLTRSASDDERQNLTNSGCGANAPTGDNSLLTAGGPAGTPGAYAALTLPLSVAISHLANAPANANTQLPAIKAVVAAAGNESNGNNLRLDADLPAGICGVVPVAALKFSSATSSAQADFSNNAFVGSNQCLKIDAFSSAVTVSLTGETRPSISAAGVNDCGLYVQPIPTATLNGTTSTGGSTAFNYDAYWNGTSFSAGWASGYIARAGMPSGPSFTVPDVQQCNFA